MFIIRIIFILLWTIWLLCGEEPSEAVDFFEWYLQFSPFFWKTRDIRKTFSKKNDCNVLFKPLLKGLGSVMQYLHRLYLQCFWKTTFWNCNLQFRILNTRCWAQNWMFGKRKFWDDCLVLISSCKKTKTWTSMNMHTRVLAHKNVHRDDDTATFFKIAPSEAKFRKTLSSQKLHWENYFLWIIRNFSYEREP